MGFYKNEKNANQSQKVFGTVACIDLFKIFKNFKTFDVTIQFFYLLTFFKRRLFIALLFLIACRWILTGPERAFRFTSFQYVPQVLVKFLSRTDIVKNHPNL